MKKLFLFPLLALLCGGINAQILAPMALRDHDRAALASFLITPDEQTQPYENLPSIPSTSRELTAGETILGITWYDLQTNKCLANRFHLFDDGTMGATWTIGLQATAFADRGTGYNFFDGNAWGAQPTARIETIRTGWPSYAPLGPDGEIIVSHDFAAHVLYFNSRASKGTGPWTQSAFTYSAGPPALSWPRMITNGEDHQTIHLLANSFEVYEGMTTATVYSRSQNGGLTWSEENLLLDGMGPDAYLEIAADEYVWAEPRGNTIAFLVASSWHDLFMMKSTDNGDTWEKTVIWEHPYPFFDWETTVTDTFFCVDNSASIALDNSGKAHVVFGINRVLHDAVGTTYSLFPFVDGIGYWNEDMPAFSNDLSALAPPQYGYPTSEMEENYNYIGWTQDVDGDGQITFITTSTGFPMYYRQMGISTMPSITVGDDGTIVVVYSSTTETYDNFEFNFKHIWARAYQNGAWGPFVDLTADIVHIFDECIYPQFGGISGDDFHILYNADSYPGNATDGDHDYTENRVVHAAVPLEELLTGINEEIPGLAESQVHQNFPNPFTGTTRIRVDLRSSESLRLEVRNSLGQVVMLVDKGRVQAGSHYITVDGENLPPGIYFYTVRAGQQTITRKMIAE